jgi:fructose-specific phosphotransferase system IIC component
MMVLLYAAMQHNLSVAGMGSAVKRPLFRVFRAGVEQRAGEKHIIVSIEGTGESAMTEEEKDTAKAVAVAGVGAGVGGAGGATVGVLELAAQGAVTGLSAGLVIGLGAAAGAGIAYGIYRLFSKRNH